MIDDRQLSPKRSPDGVHLCRIGVTPAGEFQLAIFNATVVLLLPPPPPRFTRSSALASLARILDIVRYAVRVLGAKRTSARARAFRHGDLPLVDISAINASFSIFVSATSENDKWFLISFRRAASQARMRVTRVRDAEVNNAAKRNAERNEKEGKTEARKSEIG